MGTFFGPSKTVLQAGEDQVALKIAVPARERILVIVVAVFQIHPQMRVEPPGEHGRHTVFPRPGAQRQPDDGIIPLIVRLVIEIIQV